MEFIKYFTNPQFNNVKFADMLRIKMNVRACAVEDGVILDRDAFNKVPAAFTPEWAWQNRKAINSPLHTRKADLNEWPDLTHRYRYTLAVIVDDNYPTSVEQADGIDYLTQQAELVADYWRNEEHFCGVAVIDNDTGEVMHVAE